MSTPNRFRWIGIGLVAIAGANLASAQHNWARTVTVDPTQGAADHQNIQDAIDDNKIGLDPSDRYTVLIYAGTYNENVTLGGQKENVDLVGVDRDAVIIAPSSGDGIVITSGTETARNNRIANLTIKTTYGHGIEIVKGGDPVPKNIAIEGVTIEASGDGKNGIEGSAADTVRISDCNITITAANAIGVTVGDHYEIIGTVVRTGEQTGTALALSGADGVRISNCKIEAGNQGMFIGDSANIELVGSEIRGVWAGIYLSYPGPNIRVTACHIITEGNPQVMRTVYSDHGLGTAGDIFQGCLIEALAGADTEVVTCVQVDNPQNTRYIGCKFRAVSANSSTPVAVTGINLPNQHAVTLIGGSIETSQPDYAKATQVFDIVTAGVSGGQVLVSGTRLAKWVGPITPAGRPRSVVQRTIDAGNESSEAILTETDLTGSEQPNVQPTGQPDVYRVLSVTGNLDSLAQHVYIVGTNWADDVIVEKLTLDGTATVKGLKPFKTVTKIILPAETAFGQKVKVGTTNRLGLYYPLSDEADVLQQARRASGAPSYTIEDVGTIGDDGVNYSWVEIASITLGDSIEWALLTVP